MENKTALMLLAAVVVALLFIYPGFVTSVTAAAFNGVSFSTINADTSFNLSVNVTAWNTTLSGGELVCAGPVNITATASGSYENLSNTIVPCPTYGCGPRPVTVVTPEPFPLSIVSSADYSSNVSTYYNTAFYGSYQAPNPLAPYNSTGQYYRITAGAYDPVGAPAAFSHGMFCRGSFDLFVNNVSQISVPLNATMGITNYALSSGGALVYTNATVLGCSFFIRTNETDGPTKDSAYTTAYFPRMVGTSLNFTVTNGPNFSITGAPGAFLAAPGSPVSISLPIQNTGEMNATITSIAIDSGFTVTSFSPSDINAGQATTLTILATAPAGLGTYTPTITLTYVSNTTALGTCGNGTQALGVLGNVTNGTIIIIVTPTTPISPSVFVSPSGVLSDGGQWYPSTQVVITANITRPGSAGLFVTTSSNITVYEIDPVTEQDKAPAVANFIESQGTLSSTSVFKGGILESQGIFLPFDVQLLRPAVYHVLLSTYDPAKAGTDQQTKTDSAYFTVYTLTCAEKG
ncbi:Uncharacterised protein [uncultured archaeon]|nr:Uncharacterised protein [uncultured archaeon]